tara:strand:- start:7752 stop:8423 length:672 start_codon:yes stop_codon:yes gene_type:complete
MSADKYNREKLVAGQISIRNVTRLVEYWQRGHELAVDGYAGPNTIESISKGCELRKVWPLPLLADGRQPVITSGFYTVNPSRSTHKGIDLFYPWFDTDPAVAVGNGGAIKRNQKRRWWYPNEAVAIAAADGVVSDAGNTKTGWRVWVSHEDGHRTGYFHGQRLLVNPGERVLAGQAVMVVGSNPSGWNAKHLHFEVSPIGRYAPMNPQKWLESATHTTADSVI